MLLPGEPMHYRWIGALFDHQPSSLSPDPLEEFLSILQPVMFNTPASPILRARYERPHPYKPRSHRRTRSTASASSDDSPHTPDCTTSRGAALSPNSEERDEVGDEIVFDPRPWAYSSLLGTCMCSPPRVSSKALFSISHLSHSHTESTCTLRIA
jgi:hypothetical protein